VIKSETGTWKSGVILGELIGRDFGAQHARTAVGIRKDHCSVLVDRSAYDRAELRLVGIDERRPVWIERAALDSELDRLAGHRAAGMQGTLVVA